MTKIAGLSAVVILILLTGNSPANSASRNSLDGRYISNKGNNLEIRGHRYAYRHRLDGYSEGQDGTFKSLGGERYRFFGYLRYVCRRNGTTLTCGNGKRSWYRQ